MATSKELQGLSISSYALNNLEKLMLINCLADLILEAEMDNFSRREMAIAREKVSLLAEYMSPRDDMRGHLELLKRLIGQIQI